MASTKQPCCSRRGRPSRVMSASPRIFRNSSCREPTELPGSLKLPGSFRLRCSRLAGSLKTFAALQDGFDLTPAPSPPRKCLRQGGAWRSPSGVLREGGGEPQGGGAPLAPRLLENLSPPPARHPHTDLLFNRGRGGGPRDGAYHADYCGPPSRTNWLGLSRQGSPTNLGNAIRSEERRVGKE